MPHKLKTTLTPVVPVWKEACEEAQETQLLYGENVTLLQESHEFTKVRLEKDGYEGFVKTKSLTSHFTPTHKISVQGANCHALPSVRSPTLNTLPFNVQVQVVKEEAGYALLHDGRWMYAGGLKPIDFLETDPVAVALRFLGTPYQWGGRSSFGIDCSGLIQTAFHACGIDFPRDSHQQVEMGYEINPPLQRGDLVFWKGHVGIMENAHSLIHANSFSMDVTREELSVARARILHRDRGDIRSPRRVSYKPHSTND